MNTSVVSNKGINLMKLIMAVNFNAAVIFLFIAGVLTAMGNNLLFEDQSELYGPMSNNLRLMLVYLCIVELTVYSYCHFGKNYQALLVLGIFLLLLAVSIEFYGAINEVPVDENYRWFFIYLGLSHMGFSLLIQTNKV
ncbi:MAG: hypothetical protein ACXV7J_13535 [Methylomonas sp.]